jgi:hypothetical protein
VTQEVLIALTPDVTPHLARLARSSDVWLVRTAETEQAAERLRASLPSGHQVGREGSVTLFNSSDRPEADLAGLIDEVELHHGLAAGGGDPVTVIRVIGADATPSVRSALEAYNFTDIASEPNGFVARWVAPTE